MRNLLKFIWIIALVSVIWFSFVACGESSYSSTNQTPVAGDYVIGKLNQTAGSVTAVIITPKEGKSAGTITIYYEGASGTMYARNTRTPQTAGTYAVTFDVEAVSGWNAAAGLSAGDLIVGIQPSATTPTADRESSSTIALGDNIILTTATEGATIRYTTNGNTPTTSSSLYSGPITVTSSMIRDGTVTVKAIAIRNGMINSDILEAVYPVLTAVIPTTDPVSGSLIALGGIITLDTATEGAIIRYTTNGSTPTTSSTLYSSPITVTSEIITSSTVTIKAITTRIGMLNSDVMTATYTINVPASYNVGSLEEWDAAVNNINVGGNDKEYTITVTNDFSIRGKSNNTFTPASVTVNICGNYSIALASGSCLLRIGAGQTVILEDVGLVGSSSNLNSLVLVNGDFIMRGEASVSNNTFNALNNRAVAVNATGGGVYVGDGGVFTMQGSSSVRNNMAIGHNSGSFISMNQTINYNASSGYGGGVYVAGGGTFIMRENASVSNNSARRGSGSNYGYGSGGGVYVTANGTFTMTDNASLTGNTASTSAPNVDSPNPYIQ